MALIEIKFRIYAENSWFKVFFDEYNYDKMTFMSKEFTWVFDGSE